MTTTQMCDMIRSNSNGTVYPCTNDAVWHPAVEVEEERGKKFRGVVRIFLCNECKDMVDVLSDKGWEALVRNFARRGIHNPKRETAVVFWMPVAEIVW